MCAYSFQCWIFQFICFEFQLEVPLLIGLLLLTFEYFLNKYYTVIGISINCLSAVGYFLYLYCFRVLNLRWLLSLPATDRLLVFIWSWRTSLSAWRCVVKAYVRDCCNVKLVVFFVITWCREISFNMFGKQCLVDANVYGTWSLIKINGLCVVIVLHVVSLSSALQSNCLK